MKLHLMEILTAGIPLFLASSGALVSEYAGVMAVFISGIINLSSFLTFAFTVFTGSPTAGMLLSVCVCVTFIVLTALFTEYTSSNPFLTGLAVNLACSGIISLLSSMWFKTRGVLSFRSFFEFHETSSVSAKSIADAGLFLRTNGIYAAAFVIVSLMLLLKKSRWGIRTKITGSSAEVLSEYGMNPIFYRTTAWCTAALFSAFAGTFYTFRMSSFVPNISAGTGWIAIAAVLLGQRSVTGMLLASLLFSTAEYHANYLQGSPAASFISPTILLSLPYAAALLLFVLIPPKKK